MAVGSTLNAHAAQALAKVMAMDQGMDMSDPHRHAVRNLKFLAERSLRDAFRLAMDLAAQAEDLAELVENVGAKSSPSASPEGFALVPIEPTQRMCDAAQEQKAYDEARGAVTVASNIYRAMVSSAPKPDQGNPHG